MKQLNTTKEKLLYIVPNISLVVQFSYKILLFLSFHSSTAATKICSTYFPQSLFKEGQKGIVALSSVLKC